MEASFMRRGWVYACLLFSIAVGWPARPARAQQDMLPLRVRLGDVSINKVPTIIAYEEGIYKKNGLDVQQWISPGAADVVNKSGYNIPDQYVRNAPADIGLGGGAPAIVSRVNSARGGDRIILATTDCVVRWPIIARRGINKLEDLKGKRLGFSGVGAMTHFLALVFAKRMNWDPVSDISLLANGDSFDTFQNGSVDALIVSEMSDPIVRKAGFSPLVDTRKWNVPIAGSGVTASKAWVQKNPETVRRFVKSFVDAIALMKKERESAHKAMAKWYNIKDREVAGMVYAGAAEMPRKPYPCVEGIKKTMEVYDSNEMRRYKPEDFYDASFVRELDESGYIDNLYR